MIVLWFPLAKIAGSLFRGLPQRAAAAPAYALGIIAMFWCLERMLGLFA